MIKRLEEGTFAWPRSVEPGDTKFKLTPQALAMLTDGIEWRGAGMRPWYERQGQACVRMLKKNNNVAIKCR